MADTLLKFADLREANLRRLPLFKNARGETAHSQPDGSDWSDSDWLMAVTGELGEFANLRKKVLRGDMSMEDAKQDLADELADVVIYIDILASRLGVDLGAAVVSKFDRVSDRVGCDVKLQPATDRDCVECDGFEPSGVVLAELRGLVVQDAASGELRYLAAGGCSVVIGNEYTEAHLYERGTERRWFGRCRSHGKCRTLRFDGQEVNVLRTVFGPSRHEEELAASALRDVLRLAEARRDAAVLMRRLVDKAMGADAAGEEECDA